MHQLVHHCVLVHPYFGVDGYGVSAWIVGASLITFNWTHNNLCLQVQTLDLAKDALHIFVLGVGNQVADEPAQVARLN